MDTLAVGTRAKRPRLSVEEIETLGTNAGIDREERIRAYWMIEMLDSISALGSASEYTAPPVPLAANLPCSDTVWALQDPFRENVPAQSFCYSSGFSMCISLCTARLGAVHRFQQTVREYDDMTGGLEWQTAAQRLDEKLTIWREEFVAAVFRLINTEFPQNARAEMEPFIVLTNCVLNMLVPLVYLMKYSLSSADLRQGHHYFFTTTNNITSRRWSRNRAREPSIHLTDLHRQLCTNHTLVAICQSSLHVCLRKYGCQNQTNGRGRTPKLQPLLGSSDVCGSPLLYWYISLSPFQCRIYGPQRLTCGSLPPVHTRCLRADVSINLYYLAYSLHICSHRWPLAKLYERVIRTAVAEHRTPLSETALPLEFYDHRYSVIEISHVLQSWADSFPSSLV